MMIKLLLLVAITLTSFVSSEEEIKSCEYDGLTIEEGESVNDPRYCQKITCIKAATDSISAIGCAEMIPRPGCRMSDEDNSQEYPKCCPREVC